MLLPFLCPDAFADEYADVVVHVPCAFDDLTSERLFKELKSMSDTSPGLDGITRDHLPYVAHACPPLLQQLAHLLNLVEVTGTWPDDLLHAHVSMLPKPGEQTGRADCLRPISVLSFVYRLWSRVRFQDAQHWHETWLPPTAKGARSKHSAEEVGLHVAAVLEHAQAAGESAGGITYDFAKAFDLIPHEVMFRLLALRGAPPRLLGPLRGLYSHLRRSFRVRGQLSAWFVAANGVIQGCSLSLIALNSQIACLLQRAAADGESAKGHAYADDITSVDHAPSVPVLHARLRCFHTHVCRYEQLGGGVLNARKTYSFGHADGAVEPQNHQG